MWPWDEPHSAADGILDDETYDWLAVFEAMERSGGSPIVAPSTTCSPPTIWYGARPPVDASITGTAGLAGLLAIGDGLMPGERVAVVLSGIAR